MALNEQLLKMLVDPVSKQPLTLVSGRDGKARLHCAGSGLYYRIGEHDIPNLLADEAELEDGSPATELVARLRGERQSRITSGNR